MGNITMSFYTFAALCPHCKPGFDEMTSRIEDTCRHPDNIPRGCSWGECCEKKDPDPVDIDDTKLINIISIK